jgi:hypothetical protein
MAGANQGLRRPSVGPGNPASRSAFHARERDLGVKFLMTSPPRLPDETSINAALAEPAAADADLFSARAHAFPGFQFSVGQIDDDYWRDTRSEIRPDGTSIHMLMGRMDAIDRELGLPFGWVFLMTHGHWVKAEIGQAIRDRAARAARPPA